MDPATRGRLKGTFGVAARRYASARPSYPDSVVDWLVGVTARAILDLGAGSGALTKALVSRAGTVIAAEPSHILLLELRSAASLASAVQPAAERLPFNNASFDIVTVATAFHWFDTRQALPEIARVLRPAGHLALVWNTRTVTNSWTRDLDELLRAAQPATLQGDWGAGSVRHLEASARFETPERADFAHTQRLDRSGLVDLVASRSYVIVLSDSARQHLLARVEALFDASADPGGALDLPYVAQCWRAAVRPS